jgi:hypothetical protein
MKIFISWSEKRSKAIAAALKSWLSDVLQGEDIFMSEHDVDAGTRWLNELNSELEATDFGVICLTPENLSSQWLSFEAGALSKAIKVARVIPYRLELKATDVTGPLAQFQGVDVDEAGTYKLLQSINNVRDRALTEDQLKRAFQKWWPDLLKQLEKIPALDSDSELPQRSDRALLEEILQLVRGQQPQQGYSTGDTTIWSQGQSIYQVTLEDMEQMSNSELERYIESLRERWSMTNSRSEEGVLEDKLKDARNEQKRRNQVAEHSTVPSASNIEEGA